MRYRGALLTSAAPKATRAACRQRTSPRRTARCSAAAQAAYTTAAAVARVEHAASGAQQRSARRHRSHVVAAAHKLQARASSARVRDAPRAARGVARPGQRALQRARQGAWASSREGKHVAAARARSHLVHALTCCGARDTYNSVRSRLRLRGWVSVLARAHAQATALRDNARLRRASRTHHHQQLQTTVSY